MDRWIDRIDVICIFAHEFVLYAHTETYTQLYMHTNMHLVLSWGPWSSPLHIQGSIAPKDALKSVYLIHGVHHMYSERSVGDGN